MVRYVQNYGEAVAPIGFTSYRRCSSCNPRLETIFEDFEASNSYNHNMNQVVVVDHPKRLVFLLPLLLSLAITFLFFKDFATLSQF